MKQTIVLIAMLFAYSSTTLAQKVGGGCEGCEGLFEEMPKQLAWETTIHKPGEPGEPLEINGTIFKADGKTPAPNVILYVYHTNAKGVYEPAPGAASWVKRHGHLRGWMKTDARGQYKFHTIKPAAYPGRRDPAHIHPTIKEPDKNEYYIDEYRFDNDSLLTPQERAREEKRGGSGIIKLTKNGQGVWIGRRDIVLGRNIPNYP